MKKWYRYAALAILLITLTFGVSSSASANDGGSSSPTSSTGIVDGGSGGSVVGNPGVLEQFGPPGVIISSLVGGLLLVIRSINEGKKIDVTTYKERAAEAEARSNEEIGKVHAKLGQLEQKLDNVIQDRDEYRDTLEARKASFTAQILDMEKRHQRELEDMHSALMIEVHTRHALERLLAENGITIPGTPPPFTRAMKDAAEKEVGETTQAMRVIRESE